MVDIGKEKLRVSQGGELKDDSDTRGGAMQDSTRDAKDYRAGGKEP